ncbi:MAG: aldehyde ferredoxin oxidoreductase C-terminal domain-containing protein [Myxococcota bacterium]
MKEGPYKVEKGPGSEYEAAASLGTLLLIDDRNANQKANELCNRLGMDVISAGASVAFATEAFEAGLLTGADTGGVELGWGRPDVLMDLLQKTARREGIGDDLAEGVKIMSSKYGGEEMALHVKGMEIPMHDPRALWGMALTYATSIRGACHCADANLYVELGILDLGELGVKRTWPYKAKGKAAQTVAAQKKGVLANSVVICEYVWNAMGGHMSDMAELLSAVTGFDYDFEELKVTGDRIWYLKRALGSLMGATRQDDELPRRVLEPHPEGPTSSLHLAVYPQFMSLGPVQKLQIDKLTRTLAGTLSKYVYPRMDGILGSLNKLPGFSSKRRRLSRNHQGEREKMTVPFRKMLEEFYDLREIDVEGRPRRHRLELLGLGEVATALHGSRAKAEIPRAG